MSKESFAAALNGREYGSEITEAEETMAFANGLLVIFGYSDDNVELRGAIRDEIGMYDGGRFCITSEGTVLPMWEDIEITDKEEAREYFRKDALPRIGVDCQWAPADEPTLSWRYSTTAPHATFDVMEDGEVYCRGIVLDMKEIQP